MVCAHSANILTLNRIKRRHMFFRGILFQLNSVAHYGWLLICYQRFDKKIIIITKCDYNLSIKYSHYTLVSVCIFWIIFIKNFILSCFIVKKKPKEYFKKWLDALVRKMVQWKHFTRLVMHPDWTQSDPFFAQINLLHHFFYQRFLQLYNTKHKIQNCHICHLS